MKASASEETVLSFPFLIFLFFSFFVFFSFLFFPFLVFGEFWTVTDSQRWLTSRWLTSPSVVTVGSVWWSHDWSHDHQTDWSRDHAIIRSPRLSEQSLMMTKRWWTCERSSSTRLFSVHHSAVYPPFLTSVFTSFLSSLLRWTDEHRGEEEEEAAPEQNHLQQQPAAGAGARVRKNTLPRRLCQGGPGPPGQPDRSPSPGRPGTMIQTRTNQIIHDPDQNQSAPPGSTPRPVRLKQKIQRLIKTMLLMDQTVGAKNWQMLNIVPDVPTAKRF